MNEDSNNPDRFQNTKRSSVKETLAIRRSHLYLSLIPIAFVIGLAAGYIFWGQSKGIANPGSSTPVTLQKTSQPVRYDVPVGNNPSIGPEDAPITLIEFGDYQCPYCQAWYLQVYPQIMNAYQGKIRFVYRDFPLTGIHAEASPAAEAADCAGEQGEYWPYHDKLFNGGLTLSSNTFIKYASDVDLDLDQFRNCINTNKYQDAVEDNYNFAYNLGISSTPTFFINGLAIIGSQPYSVFKQVIDQELAGQIAK